MKSPAWAMALERGALLGLAVLAVVFPRLPTQPLLVVAPALMLWVLGLSLFIMRSVWWPPLYPRSSFYRRSRAQSERRPGFLVLKALSKDVNNRYQSATEFAHAIRESRAT